MVWQEEADRRSEDCLQPHQEHVQGTHFGTATMFEIMTPHTLCQVPSYFNVIIPIIFQVNI